MKRISSYRTKLPLELVFWVGAIIGVMMIDTSAVHHFTLCPVGLMGFDWCPGCGLGRSMKLLLEGEWMASFEMHPLGSIAWAVILFRIYQLIRQLKTIYNYG